VTIQINFSVFIAMHKMVSNLDALPLQSMTEDEAKELQKEMDAYLEDVIKPRKQADLQSSREQITRCFEKISCFQLPHPGEQQFQFKLNHFVSLRT